MTTKRKTWFIGWAIATVLIGIVSGGMGAIFPLVILGFIELIRLLIASVKHSKQKFAAQEERLEKIKEQTAVFDESSIASNPSPQNDSTEQVNMIRERKPMGTQRKSILVDLIVTVLSPIQPLIDPFIKLFTGKNYENYARSVAGLDVRNSKTKVNRGLHEKHSSAIKKCGSCQYWGGTREIDRTRRWVSYYQYDKGECIGGGRNKLQVQGCASCSKYMKWGNLQ
jgi:hypothetical protein